MRFIRQKKKRGGARRWLANRHLLAPKSNKFLSKPRQNMVQTKSLFTQAAGDLDKVVL